MRAREDVGSNRRRTLAANFNQGCCQQREKQARYRRTKPISKGCLRHQGTDQSSQHKAEENPPQDHARARHALAHQFQIIRPTRLERCKHALDRRPDAIPLGQISRIRIRRDSPCDHQSIHDPSGHHRHERRKQNENDHPFPTDQRRKDQRERQRVPWTRDEKGNRLTQRSAAFVQAHAHHQDAVIAKIEHHARAHRTKKARHRPALAEHRSNQLTRKTPDHRHRHNPKQQSPPRTRQQLGTSMTIGHQPHRRSRKKKMHRHAAGKQEHRCP